MSPHTNTYRSTADIHAQTAAIKGYLRLLTSVVENTALERSKTMYTLLFTSLKVVPLGVLPLCLEKIQAVLRSRMYRQFFASEETFGKGVAMQDLLEIMHGVIAKINDSHRRAVIATWWARQVKPIVRL